MVLEECLAFLLQKHPDRLERNAADLRSAQTNKQTNKQANKQTSRQANIQIA
jgi:hypothetical protein